MRIILIVLSSIITLPYSFTFKEVFELDIELVQKGKIYKITDELTTLHMDKDSFSIFFNLREYELKKGKYNAMQIAVTDKRKYAEIIKVGKKVEDIFYFSAGTGMATAGPYESFAFVQDEVGGHHYIIFEKKGEQRAVFISEKNGAYRLRADINKFIIDEKQVDVNAVKNKDIYIIMFSDLNYNKVVDKGELKKIVIQF